jgi:hypothetical protein
LSATVSAVRLAIVRSDGLVGRWRLDSYIARHEDGSVAYPLGEAASGSLVYTAGGWMSGHLAAAERPNLTVLRTEPTQFGGEIVVAELRWTREE